METLESIKAQLRVMTAKQREAQEKECGMIVAHPSATANDRAEARMILQAIAELEREREERVQRASKAATEIVGIIRETQEEQQARILAKAMRINGIATGKPQQGRPEKVPTDARRADLHPMSTEAYNQFAKWYKTGTIPALMEAKDEIYKAFVSGATDKDVARKIFAIYNKIDGRVYNTRGALKRKPTWNVFLSDFAAAYGAQITDYKPSQLR